MRHNENEIFHCLCQNVPFRLCYWTYSAYELTEGWHSFRRTIKFKIQVYFGNDERRNIFFTFSLSFFVTIIVAFELKAIEILKHLLILIANQSIVQAQISICVSDVDEFNVFQNEFSVRWMFCQCSVRWMFFSHAGGCMLSSHTMHRFNAMGNVFSYQIHERVFFSHFVFSTKEKFISQNGSFRKHIAVF